MQRSRTEAILGGLPVPVQGPVLVPVPIPVAIPGIPTRGHNWSSTAGAEGRKLCPHAARDGRATRLPRAQGDLMARLAGRKDHSAVAPPPEH